MTGSKSFLPLLLLGNSRNDWNEPFAKYQKLMLPGGFSYNDEVWLFQHVAFIELEMTHPQGTELMRDWF